VGGFKFGLSSLSPKSSTQQPNAVKTEQFVETEQQHANETEQFLRKARTFVTNAHRNNENNWIRIVSNLVETTVTYIVKLYMRTEGLLEANKSAIVKFWTLEKMQYILEKTQSISSSSFGLVIGILTMFKDALDATYDAVSKSITANPQTPKYDEKTRELLKMYGFDKINHTLGNSSDDPIFYSRIDMFREEIVTRINTLTYLDEVTKSSVIRACDEVKRSFEPYKTLFKSPQASPPL
jgi:hypothetical protein